MTPRHDRNDAAPAAGVEPWVLLVPLLLASAAIHAAAAPVHFDQATSHGVAFVVFAVAGAALAAALVHRGSRRFALVASVPLNAGLVALWAVSRTAGLPGTGVEEVGLSDAVASALAAAAIGLAAIGLASLHPARSTRALSASFVVAAMVLAVPAVAQAGDHDHGQRDHGTATPPGGALDRTSISALFASVPHDHRDQGTVVRSTKDDGPCEPTPAQVAAADRLVAETTLALQRYRDVNVAVADGYVPLGFEPNGVHHYLHHGYRTDGAVLDPSRPESLLYGRTPTGDLFPVGAMYMMPDKATAGPRIGGCLTTWHSHGFPFAAPGDSSVEMMHVWTVPLPGGPFAEHVEGAYARIYLGLEPIEDDDENALFARREGAPSITVPGGLERFAGVDAGAGIVAILNALNVHGPAMCDLPLVRSAFATSLNPLAVERICDPVLNSPLPGARSPGLAQVLALVAANR
jgi:hypothetical protein